MDFDVASVRRIYLEGGDGDDVIIQRTDFASTLIGGNGRDWLGSGGGVDVINGNGGNDYIDGGGGNDTLVGGKGRDSIYGRAGDDLLLARDNQIDRVHGGDGTDQAVVEKVKTKVKDLVLEIESFL
jgi:Ca2+-binding RTX toxin-like protein